MSNVGYKSWSCDIIALHKTWKEVMKEVHLYLDLNLRLSKTEISNRKETKEDVKFRYVALRLNLL